MGEPYRIAVIEDNPRHLRDIQGLLGERSDLFEADFATNMDAAHRLLRIGTLNGVLSDALFPRYEGGPEAACGVEVIDWAMKSRVPFTIVTSTFHHGRKTEPVSVRSRNSGLELIDFNPGYGGDVDYNSESDTKRWSDGLATLVYLIDALREGNLKFDVAAGPGADGTHIGMLDDKGRLIKFSLPFSSKHDSLKRVREKIGLEPDIDTYERVYG